MDIQTNFDAISNAAFAVDRQGTILLWNPKAEETLGYPATEAQGKNCWDLLVGKDSFGNLHCCPQCPIRVMSFNHQPVNSFISAYRAASGEDKVFMVSCLSVFDKPGNEMMLHICTPESNSAIVGKPRTLPALRTRKVREALSRRELEILTLLADGKGTADVASELSISIRTVRTHIQHLMYKLQVHKRREAVLAARKLNLIQPARG